MTMPQVACDLCGRLLDIPNGTNTLYIKPARGDYVRGDVGTCCEDKPISSLVDAIWSRHLAASDILTN